MRHTFPLSTALMFAALVVRAELPVISYAGDDVNGNETLLLCGDGFDQPGLEIQRWLPPQPAREDWPDEKLQRNSLERALKGEAKWPIKPDGRPAKLSISEITRHTCAARLPQGGYCQVQALYLLTAEGAAPPWIINRPKLWWVSPEFAEPGARIRCFGRNLSAQYGGGRAAWLRDAHGVLQRLEYGMPYGVQPGYDGNLTAPYELDVQLPGDLVPGDYDLFVHNGSGGDFGWSEPFKLTVRSPPTVATFIIKASDHGAVADDDASDSAALEKALAAAAARPDGGIVQLAPGVYHLSRNLKLPPKTRLRGAGKGATTIATMNNAPVEPFDRENSPNQDAGYYKAVTGVTPMVWLPEQCGLEQLSLRGAPDTLVILIGTRSGVGSGISLRDCAIVNRHPVWFRNGQYRFSGNCVLIAGATDGLEISGCFIEGSGPVTSLMQLLRRAHISGNTFTSFPPGRSDCTGFRKPMECIIEENYFINAKRGLVIQPQGMAVHNLVANNHVEHTERGGNAGEVELWEGGTVAGAGKVRTADANTLTCDGVQWERTDRKGNKSNLREKAVGYVCLITKGRGLGQYRFIRKINGDTLTLDRPWEVSPSAGAEFVITTSSIENLILNNTDRDGDAGMQFWGGAAA